MGRSIIIFSFMLFFWNSSFSQNERLQKDIIELDSVINVLNNYEKNDSVKVELLIEISERKDKIYNKQDTIYPELIKAFSLAKKNGYELGKARVMIIYSDMFNKITKLDSALIYALNAVEILEKYPAKLDLLNGYSMLSTIYTNTNEFHKSLNINLKSIELIKNEKNLLPYSRLFFSTGKAYEGIKDYDEAIKYYTKAKNISLNHDFGVGVAISEGAIGSIYKSLKQYEKALPLLKNTLEFSKKSGHNQVIASSHLELGSTLAGLEKYEESIFHFKESIKVFKKMGSINYLKRLYNELGASYEKLGLYQKAIDNYKFSKVFSDSIYTKDKAEVIKELQTKYETEKITKEKELAIANQLVANEKAESSRNISIGAIIFACIIGLLLLFIFNRLKLIRNQKRELDEAYDMLEESKKFELAASNLKALKSQMNPHFIFNSLNSIQDLILKEDTDTSYDYIVLFAELVRNTLTYSKNEFIPFNKEVDFLSVYLKLEELRFGDDFKFNIETNGIDEIKVPSLIIQPFLENSLKHGLLHKEGLKELSLEFKMDKELTCIILDNGVGRKESERIQERRGNKSHESFAMGAIKKRLDLLSERFEENFSFEVEDLYEYDIAKGTKITVVIPFEDEF